MDEQRLERALRQGPPFATRYVPAPMALDDAPAWRPRVGTTRLVLLIAGTALLVAALLTGLVVVGTQNPHLPHGPAANGWIAFVRDGSIFLTREGKPARRIIGSDGDPLERLCPAISPDGRRLAHGEAEGTFDTGYRDAAVVISDLDAAGNALESRRIEVGGTFPPPCAAWSADGRRVAFATAHFAPGSHDRLAAGSEVWVASVADGHVDVLPDLAATDLEWSPDASVLAIATGQVDSASGQSIGDGSVRLYHADSGVTRTLVEAARSGVWNLTWSPDGSRIAYQQGGSDGGRGDQEIRLVRVDGSGDHRLTRSRFGAIHGVGPVWSPTGDRIVYQRMIGGENHEVVLLNPEDGSEVVLPELRLPRNDASWRPDSVTWSPDGKELLYSAWINGKPGRSLIARPLDLRSETVLVVDGLDPAGKNRSWGRLADP